MARIESWFEQDLKKPVKVRMIEGNVFSQDNHANLIGVAVMDGGQAATLNGAVSASILRADGQTVAQTGTLSGNKCSVVLPASAYTVPGPVIITLKLTGSEEVTTLLSIIGNVYRTSTDTIVDPGTIIPSVEALIAALAEAEASIPQEYSALENSVNITRFLDNNGEYLFLSTDFESGYWAYSNKSTNSKRIRNKYLIPVYSGMQIHYANPTMKMFIGVLPSLDGNTYIQQTGWVNAGRSGIVTIRTDGYMTLMFEGTTDIFPNDYDSTVIIESAINTELKENTDQLKRIAAENGIYTPRFYNKELTDLDNGLFSVSDKALSTDVLHFYNKFLKITFATGYKGNVYFMKQDGTTVVNRAVSEGSAFLYAGRGVPVCFTIRHTDDSKIFPYEARSIVITEIDTEAAEDVGSGIRLHKVEYDKAAFVSSSSLYYAPLAGRCVSAPIKIPKSGLRIGYTPKYHSKVYIDDTPWGIPPFRVVVVKKKNYGMQIISEEKDANLYAVSMSTVYNFFSVYIPYVESTLGDDYYVIIVLTTENRVVQDDYSDLLYVSSGEVTDSFRGVYNIFPTYLYIDKALPDFESKNSLRIGTGESLAYSYSSSLYYATIVRLRDVKKIVCSPKYTLLAEIFKIEENDVTIHRYGDVYGAWSQDSPSGQTGAAGLCCIDFSDYDFDGFAIVAIQGTITYAATSTGYTQRRQTMGGLARYEDVKNSVSVIYKNGVTVSYVGGMPAIIEENIHKLCNWKVPFFGEGFYVEQADTVPRYIPNQYDCVPIMYNGTFIANSLLMQVTPKSALTCLKNRNGRMRKMQRVENESLGNIGYGLTCTNLTSVIHGLKENYTSWSYAHQDKPKFDTYDFDYRTDLDKLRPGDILTKSIPEPVPEFNRSTNSHCMTVSSIVCVNGAIKAVNVFEAGAPYPRYKPYIDESYYITSESPIVTARKIEELGNYKWINRIKPEYLKPIDLAFPMWVDSTEVGTVMCDRGTDSIYGEHTQYVELSFKDEDVTTNLYLYKDDSLIATIPKSGATTVNGLQMINVAQYLDGEGLYTVKTDQSEDVQETFFVKGDVAPIQYTQGEDGYTFTIPNMSSFVQMDVWYGTTTTPEEKANRKSPTYVKQDMDIDWETEIGTITIPASIEGKNFTAITLVYNTEYGTYHCGLTGRVSSDYYGLD